MKFNKDSIKYKVLVPIWVLLISVSLIIFFTLEKLEKKYTEKQIVKQGQNIVNSIVNSLEAINAKSLLRRVIKNNSLEENVNRILIVDEEDRVFVGNEMNFDDKVIRQIDQVYADRIEKMIKQSKKHKTTEYFYNPHNHDVVLVTRIYLNLQRIDQRQFDSLFLVIHLNGKSYFKEISTISHQFMIIGIVVLTIVLAIIFFAIVYHVINPLNVLVTMINRLSRNEDIKLNEEEMKNLTTNEFQILGETYIKQFKALTLVNHKLTEAKDAKQAFLAHMSHEIRTPLNGILGVTEILNDTPLDETQQNLISVINRSGQNLLGIVNDILDLSKIEAGKLSIVESEFSLCKMVSDLLTIFNPIVAKKNIIFHSTKNFEKEILVISDYMRLQQVLINLINNAIKFTENGHVELNIHQDEMFPDRFTFKIIDTGIGMSEEQVKRLFQPFEQTDKSITRKYGGTGLGLVICKQILELLHGDIEVYSKFGEGTTFKISLKLKIANDNKMEYIKLSNQLLQFDSMIEDKILIVDDNDINRMVAKSFLDKIAKNLLEANDGRLAFDVYMAKRPKYILMDLQMPVMDGYTSTKEIRKFEAENNLEPSIIIAVTSHALQEEMDRALKNGFDYYLTKPLRKQTLFQLLHRLTQENPKA